MSDLLFPIIGLVLLFVIIYWIKNTENFKSSRGTSRGSVAYGNQSHRNNIGATSENQLYRNNSQNVIKTTSSEGLSTGAIVGIVAGAIFSIIIIIGIIIFILRKKNSSTEEDE